MNEQQQATPADVAAAITAIDGHVVGRKTFYKVVVTANKIERFASEALPIDKATERMAKTIAFHISTGGYKQTPGGGSVTLTKGPISLELTIVEVANV